MDLEEYHNETLTGEVSSESRIDAQMLSVSEWEKTSIDHIKTLIGRYGLIGSEENVDAVAQELYNRFSIKDLCGGSQHGKTASRRADSTSKT